MVGSIRWSGQPVENVAKTPLVAGQWQRQGTGIAPIITDNSTAREIPVGGKLELLG